jgi:hypothetical protein
MLKDDIKKVKEQGKLFERLSSDYDIGNIYINKPLFSSLVSTFSFSITKECRCIKNEM